MRNPNPYSAGIDFKRQILTSVDVSFSRSVSALKGLTNVTRFIMFIDGRYYIFSRALTSMNLPNSAY